MVAQPGGKYALLMALFLTVDGLYTPAHAHSDSLNQSAGWAGILYGTEMSDSHVCVPEDEWAPIYLKLTPYFILL